MGGKDDLMGLVQTTEVNRQILHIGRNDPV